MLHATRTFSENNFKPERFIFLSMIHDDSVTLAFEAFSIH